MKVTPGLGKFSYTLVADLIAYAIYASISYNNLTNLGYDIN